MAKLPKKLVFYSILLYSFIDVPRGGMIFGHPNYFCGAFYGVEHDWI